MPASNDPVVRLTMPNGDILECEYPTASDWARSWSVRYPDTGQIGTTGEQDWEVVERYGLTAILEAVLKPSDDMVKLTERLVRNIAPFLQDSVQMDLLDEAVDAILRNH